METFIAPCSAEDKIARLEAAKVDVAAPKVIEAEAVQPDTRLTPGRIVERVILGSIVVFFGAGLGMVVSFVVALFAGWIPFC